MQKKTSFIFMLVCTISSVAVHAQQRSIKVLAEVPVQFGVGYEGQVSKHFSVGFSAGLLTQPNSTLIINVLQQLGTDEQITLMIKEAFTFGVVGEVRVNYNFRRYYVGAFFQVIALQAGDTPTNLVESYFGTDISNYPLRGRAQIQNNEKYLHLSSTLYQAGLLFGRRFPLKNRRLEIDTEFGMSANAGSKSKLTADTRNLSALSTEVDSELKRYYAEYAFIPSVSVVLAYKLRRG